MLSSSESLGKKIRKLLRSFNIKHLDLLHLNALTDEEITHRNVLRFLVIRRVLSKAQRALVVTEKSCSVNMEADRIKQTLNKNLVTSQRAANKCQSSMTSSSFLLSSGPAVFLF